MPINVIDTLKQKNSAEFPLVEDIDLLGGFRIVDTTITRDAIPVSYRKTGMFCFTTADNKLWRLTSLPSVLPGTWVEFAGGGTPSGSAIVDSTLLAGENLVTGDPVAIGPLGTLILADAHESDPVRQEVHGLVVADRMAGDPVDVAMAGLLSYTSGFAMGQVLYLGVGGGTGGGLSVLAPIGASPPGRRIIRIGQVHDASTVMVRVQLIAEL